MYPAAEFGRLVSDVRAVMEDREQMEQHLKMQRKDAMAEEKEAYTVLTES